MHPNVPRTGMSGMAGKHIASGGGPWLGSQHWRVPLVATVRSCYDAADALNFVSMEKFQKDWLRVAKLKPRVMLEGKEHYRTTRKSAKLQSGTGPLGNECSGPRRKHKTDSKEHLSIAVIEPT
jgi:hypothetical protein